MGFSLKKTIKKVTSNPLKAIGAVVNPTTYFGTDGVMKAFGMGGLGDMFKGKPGPDNPNAPPNLAYLYDTSRLDPLKDSSKFDFLRTDATAAAAKLGAGGAKNPWATAGTPRPSESLFNDLIGNIRAPSSVDAVRGEVEGDRMRQILAGVDEDTARTVGSTKMDFLDRGLAGPGMMSDIEANALATDRANADKLKAATRTEYAGKELDRLKAQEEALRGAYGARYAAGVDADTQAAQLAESGLARDLTRDVAAAELGLKGGLAYADAAAARDALYAQLLNARDLGAAGIQSSLFTSGEDRKLAGKEPSLFDKLLSRVSLNIGG